MVGDLDHDAVPAERALELVRRALDNDAAVVDDRESVGEVIGLVEVVGREEDGELFDGGQTGDLVPELRAGPPGRGPSSGSSRKRTVGRATRPTATSSLRSIPPL
jgi:hypothetical protein